MFRKLQFTGVLSFGIIFYFFENFSKTYSGFLCLFLILLLGIPHGAIDHKIHQSISRNKNLFQYIITYLLTATGYVIWWIIDPAKALLIFILLSAYHFGQEFLEDKNLKVEKNKPAFFILWGSLILISPLLFSLDEVSDYLHIVTGYSFSNIPLEVSICIVLIIYLLAICHLVYLFVKKQIAKADLVGLIGFVVVNTALHLLLDFVIAFTIYFVLFHSLNAFRHQFSWLSERNKNYTIKKFIADLSVFALIAIFGIAIIIGLIRPSDMEALISIFFIMISLITLPHAVTLNQFYQFRKKSGNSLS
ncbi:MAG: Brp/Blh family beta-carotene 15,15'-dioxygenase [Ekhidna sp.]|nr:Brp/Blh family beta-carotene 15,15'-dioxygenase [Ekhidna sp.]MBC6411078.1 Brp/Blh family beta-carotene 15,15'-dioxygenase [Ekhidna sp.]